MLPCCLAPQVDLDGAEVEDSSSAGSGSEGGDDMDEDMVSAAAAPAAVPHQPAQPAPVVDADGFEMVQKRRGRR